MQLKSVKLIVDSAVRDLEVQKSMVLGVETAWAKRQELMHTRVNTLLTMVATIFLPLTFLCGVYGMNFDDDNGMTTIPLTLVGQGYGGYLVFWGIVVLFVMGLYAAFYFLNWFALVGLSERES